MNYDRTRIYAVAGRPILHSRSPEMFNAAFASVPVDAVYTRLTAPCVEDVIRIVREAGFSGLNITSPFKESVIPLLDNISEEARVVGAVNTVLVNEGRFTGHNTDVEGVREALRCHGVSPFGKRAVVIGAGGAARAALCALRSEGAEVVVANRTFHKAAGLAEEFGCRATPLQKVARDLREDSILISAVPALEETVLPSIPGRFTVLDGRYASETTLCAEARRRGCMVIDGREWLLFQGAAAFRLFTGLEAPLEAMRAALYRRCQGDRRNGDRNVAFVGFMGTGKSSVAAETAKRAGMTFIDIDGAIEEEAGCVVFRIFSERGEAAFRDMEEREIHRIRPDSQVVIACGGGAVLRPQNRETLKNDCTVIWLWAGMETVRERIDTDGKRPLYRSDDSAVIRQMLADRLSLYASVSDLVISSENGTPADIAESVLKELSLHKIDGEKDRKASR